MRVTLSSDERAVVEATIVYANAGARGIDLERRLFAAMRVPPEVKRSINPHVDRVFQAELRQWLAEIARKGEAAFLDIAPHLQEMFREGTRRTRAQTMDALTSSYWFASGFVLAPILLRRSRRLIHRPVATSTAALLAYGTALILDRDRGLARRLGQCGWCGRFNLTFEGRPRTHCNDQHRLLYDQKMAASRMKRMRERRKREKRGKGRG